MPIKIEFDDSSPERIRTLSELEQMDWFRVYGTTSSSTFIKIYATRTDDIKCLRLDRSKSKHVSSPMELSMSVMPLTTKITRLGRLQGLRLRPLNNEIQKGLFKDPTSDSELIEPSERVS